MESEADWDGGAVQIRVYDSGAWGSWITLDMTDTGIGGIVPNDTDVDGLADAEDGWSGTQPAGEWDEVTIDLYNLTTTGLTTISSSNRIQLRFWFGSDATSHLFPGWYIDDFSLSGILPCGGFSADAGNARTNDADFSLFLRHGGCALYLPGMGVTSRFSG